MQIEMTRSKTARIVEEFLLFDELEDDDGEIGGTLDDEVLSSAGGPYRWEPLEEMSGEA